MSFTSMTATDAVSVIQSLEFIADGGSKKLTEAVGSYAQSLSDAKSVGVAVTIENHFNTALAEEFMRKRGLIGE